MRKGNHPNNLNEREQMADLFQRDKSTISRHVKNVFEAVFRGTEAES